MPDLYRLYDADDRLLYVGVSHNAAERCRHHSFNKPWWADVAYCTLDWRFSDREALRDELRAIKDELPLHNKRGAVQRAS